jgi:hypothetical protein
VVLAFSPDGAIVVYDTSTCNAGAGPLDKSCDCDSDPSATLSIVPAAGGTPVVLAHANSGHPLADAGTTALTNSYPKWSPFVFTQTATGGRLLWLTFSSTRKYGFRAPPATCSDESVSGSFVWMVGIDLDKAEIPTGGDPSFPPFVLPFQDFTTSNHIAQWTTTVVKGPP